VRESYASRRRGGVDLDQSVTAPKRRSRLPNGHQRHRSPWAGCASQLTTRATQRQSRS
jgi:hypothetical protein